MNERPKDTEANLRFLDWNHKCTLTFTLHQPETEKFTAINDNVYVVRQMTENVDALLKHTANKVQNVLENHLKKDEDKENQTQIDLGIALKNKNKPINGGTELTNIQKFKHMTFSILNCMFKVIVNAPLIENIKLPEVIYTGHAVQPALLKAILANHEKSKYFWYKSKDKEHWELIGSDYHYNVAEDDVGYYLKFKCLPINIYSQGEPFEVESSGIVSRVPEVPYCPFQDRQKETPRFLTGNQFRVVSYNTLSCRYANDQYNYCPIEYLAIDYRKQLLLKEMFGYNADVLCCQEVDNKIYSFYFRPEFHKINYGSIYNKKGNRIPEGLAIFYNKSRFSFADQGQIVFNLEIKTNRTMRNIMRIIENDDEAYDTFMKQPSSMQFILLKSKNSNQTVILANTHLYYHPDANNIRLLQTAVCLEFLRGLHQKEMKKNTNVSLLFCGDLNSKPESDVYKFITEGAIQYTSKSFSTTLFIPFSLLPPAVRRSSPTMWKTLRLA
ncbi:2',5'-phosphodiesterase 12-like [Atheta coriaria]|uniref:2',5'-phosphodiesterase 12-like n=1 Tax=Dalotia coriaria TaxID=877792 RepID=UPI0031F40B63